MKQVILMRNDLGMSVGKMCAQAAHASRQPNIPTVVVSVNEEQLINCLKQAQTDGLAFNQVIDAGHTEVPEGTTTCGSIYGKDDKVNKITGQLPLL